MVISQDETLEIVNEFKSNNAHLFHDFKIIVHERNFGVSRARNDGIKASKGTYVLILDSDVVLPHNAISELVKLMERDPALGCCRPLLTPYSETKISKWLFDVDRNRKRRIMSCADAAMIRREVFEKAGFYDEELGFFFFG